MDNMVSLLHAIGPAAINQEVRSKMLELIQAWATAAEGRYDLKYIEDTYKNLQNEGYQFPPRVTVATSMIDSSAVCQFLLAPHRNKVLIRHLLVASRVVRLGSVYAMQNCLFLHEPEAPLPQLWQLLRPAVLRKNIAPAALGHIGGRQS